MFSIPRQTLHGRISGRFSHSTSHETMQHLSKPEERTLVRWITHLTNTGFLASPALVVKMAEEIRTHRYPLSKTPPSFLRPMSKNWIGRFRMRHPDIRGIWAREIEGARHKAMRVETVNTWFEAVEELYLQHQYPPERI